MSQTSVTKPLKKGKKSAKLTLHIKESVDSTIEDKIASPFRTVKDMFSDLAFGLLDLSTEVRAKTTSLAKYEKKVWP